MVVVVKHLVKENDNTENTITKLTTTKYGTIIGDNGFEETTVEKFIKSLEKGINNEEEDIKKSDSNDLEYMINDNAILTINPIDHYYPVLLEKLNELCEASSYNTHKKNVIDNFETQKNLEKYDNPEDLKIYLEELKLRKMEYTTYIILDLVFLKSLIPVPLALFILAITGVLPELFSLSIGGTAIGLFILPASDLKQYINNNRKNKEKIEIVERKIKHLENEKNINLVSSEKEILKLDSNNDNKYIPKRTEYKEPVRQGVKKKELILHHKRS